MKTFVKNYIGKGKQVAGLSIAKVTCKHEDLQKFPYLFDGTEYVTFEVAKMKQADSFGWDYTVYVSQVEEEKTEKPAKERVHDCQISCRAEDTVKPVVLSAARGLISFRSVYLLSGLVDCGFTDSSNLKLF